jgi:hypothetical protein
MAVDRWFGSVEFNTDNAKFQGYAAAKKTGEVCETSPVLWGSLL